MRAHLAFIVLEGFSGTGKTSLALELEKRGWLRLTESAHAVTKDVPVAERADTAADFSLLGATMMSSSVVAKYRGERNIVSEGYLLADLAYAKIRYELKKSDAYPSMAALVRNMLREPALRPDLYILLRAGEEVIDIRQMSKGEREKNLTEFFRTRYYTALAKIHEEMREKSIEVVETDSDVGSSLRTVLGVLARHGVTVT